MSLDGFITGPNHAMEWAFERGAPSQLADEVMHSTGAILAGRRWYDVATERYGGRGGIYGGKWSGPVFVLTHDPPPDPEDPEIAFLTAGIGDALDAARAAAPTDKNVEIFGADIARQCIEAGLLDEMVVHVVPVMLGDGVRLYTAVGAPRIDLHRVALEDSGEQVSVRYRVRAR
jgi:dihydrofolate reductase